MRPSAPGLVPSLGQRLRQRRWTELRVFQATLAQAVGISAPYLSQLEHGTARLTRRPCSAWPPCSAWTTLP